MAELSKSEQRKKSLELSLDLLYAMAKADNISPKQFQDCQEKILEDEKEPVKSIQKKYGSVGVLGARIDMCMDQ